MHDRHVFFSTSCQGKLESFNSDLKMFWNSRMARRKATRNPPQRPPTTQQLLQTRRKDWAIRVLNKAKTSTCATTLQQKRSTTRQLQIFRWSSSLFSSHFLPQTTALPGQPRLITRLVQLNLQLMHLPATRRPRTPLQLLATPTANSSLSTI